MLVFRRDIKFMKNFAILTAKKAGKLILNHFNRLGKSDVTYKSSHELLTKFDLQSEKLIISEIQNKYPDHAIISEEAGELPTDSDYTWIIDPLDGTTNFKIGSPFWAVSIGLVYKNEIILGVIYAPAMKELYVAEYDKGAYLNNIKLHVSSQNDFANAINAYCHGSNKNDIVRAVEIYNHLKLHTRDCRQLGSAALELGFVAAGRIESINIPGAHKWDVAAGVLLVREAGGKVTDFAGENWNLGSKDILASNGLVHNQLLEIINK